MALHPRRRGSAGLAAVRAATEACELGAEESGPLGAAVFERVAERTRNLEQRVEIEIYPGARLLRHLVLDRKVEVVRTVVERLEGVLVLGQDRRSHVLDVVEEHPRQRDVPPVFAGRDLGTAEGSAVRLVRPAEEREQAAGLVLEVACALQVLQPFVE